MISCFLLHGETSDWGLKHVIVILVIAQITQISTADELTHYTESTNCQINFQLQDPANQDTVRSPNKLIFKKCVRKVCQSYQINGLCRSEQQYNLEEWKCIQQCCGSSSFDFLACSDYNKLHEQRSKNSTGTLIAALSISITGLLIAAIIFVVRYIKCCPKKQPQEDNKNQTEDTNTQKGRLSTWKPCQFNLQYQCFQCKEKGAFAMLPCGKMYHIKCFNSEKWECSHCSNPIAKIKVYCTVCLKCSLMVRADSCEQAVERVLESYSWHPHWCEQYLQEGLGLETERKLTQVTSSSP